MRWLAMILVQTVTIGKYTFFWVNGTYQLWARDEDIVIISDYVRYTKIHLPTKCPFINLSVCCNWCQLQSSQWIVSEIQKSSWAKLWRHLWSVTSRILHLFKRLTLILTLFFRYRAEESEQDKESDSGANAVSLTELSIVEKDCCKENFKFYDKEKKGYVELFELPMVLTSKLIEFVWSNNFCFLACGYNLSELRIR